MIRLPLLALSLSGSLLAQNDISWVASNGNDGSSCTMTSPCATFTGALFKTNTGGAVYALTSGDFGSFTLTRSMIVDGRGHGVRAAGVALNLTGETVTLRNLIVDTQAGVGGTYGIGGSATSGGAGPSVVNLENITVSGSPGSKSMLALSLRGGSSVYLTDVTVTGGTQSFFNNGSDSTPGRVTLTRVEFRQASVVGLSVGDCQLAARDALFRGNFDGLVLIGHAQALIRNSEFSHNTRYGLYSGVLSSSPGPRIDGSTFSHNATGVGAAGGAAPVVSYRTNLFFNNTVDGAPALTTSYR